MTDYQFIAASEDENCRIDLFLSARIENMSRSAAAQLAEKGNIFADGRPVRKNYRLRAGEHVEAKVPEAAPAAALPEDIPLDVVYEDGDIIVINKPKGMVVHPAAGNPDGTLVNALLAHCGSSLSGIGGERRPGIVHRIDKDTSGLLVAAKNDRAHQSLAAQIAAHTAGRVYEAVVVGHIPEQEGTIRAPIGRCRTDRKKMAVVPDGREAVTHYRVLAEYPGYSLVRCRLETGRTHQIRVHFASIGHPVAGDTVYGGKKPVGGLHGQCLHACELHFAHPITGEEMSFKAERPAEFEQFLRKISKNDLK